MILLSVGVNDYDYSPLFREMDRIAPSLGEDVVMQTGGVEFHAENCETVGIVPEDRMRELFDSCRLVVCHAGIGTITNVLEREKPMVLAPRSVVIDSEGDQQDLVADKVVSLGRGVRLRRVDDLLMAIREAESLTIPPYRKDTSLCDWLDDLLTGYASSI